MKTIFVSILTGVEAKNILRTNILGTILARPDVTVVLFLKSRERVAMYEKEFSHPRLKYEVVEKYPFNWTNKIFEFLKHYVVRTKTLALYKRLVLEDTHNYFVFFGGHIMHFLLAHSLVRKIMRIADYYLCRDKIFSAFFEKYNPDLIFLANLFEMTEVSFLREAKHRGVKNIGFINSWDKVTAKGFMRLLPDTLIVPNNLVRDEAVMHDDADMGRLIVSGIPQYDTYFDQNNLLSREAFFAKIKADPNKKLIVFGPMGRSLSDSDWQAIDMLHNVIDKHFKDEAELLVRFQPNDFGGEADKEEIKKRPWLRYDIPGIRFSTTRGTDWDMTKEDLIHLKNTLYHMSILVSYASSISIDTACFNKPVINIGFEVREKQPALKQPSRRYATEHYGKALATGGIRLVKDEVELVEWIKKYLENPTMDDSGRKKLVGSQVWKTDGRAGERIANAVLNELQ